MEYRVKPDILVKYPVLVTTVQTPEGKTKTVSLTGFPVTIDRQPTAKSPGERITIPAATAKEMELIHKSGHPFTEAIEPEKKVINKAD